MNCTVFASIAFTPTSSAFAFSALYARAFFIGYKINAYVEPTSGLRDLLIAYSKSLAVTAFPSDHLIIS